MLGNLVTRRTIGLRSEKSGTASEIRHQRITRCVTHKRLANYIAFAVGRPSVGIVDLVIAAQVQQSRKVALPFGVGRNGKEFCVGLAVIELLESEKPKQLVLSVVDLGQYHRSTDGNTILVELCALYRYSRAIIEKVVGGQPGRLSEAIQGAVELVGAGLHHLINGAAAGVTIRRIGIEGFNFYFLNCFLRWRIGDAVIPGGVRCAIHHDFRCLRRCAANTPGRCCAIVKGMDKGGIRRGNHADRQLCHHHRIASIQRKVFNLLGADGLSG